MKVTGTPAGTVIAAGTILSESQRDLDSRPGSSGPLPLTPFESGLLLDGAFGEGLGCQPLVRDPCPALNRQAERALREARFGADYGCKLVP